MIDISEENLAFKELLTGCTAQKELQFQDDLLSNYMCILCYGIAIDPVKCTTCETVYCDRCLPDDAQRPDHITKPCRSGNRYECYKKCGSRTLASLGRIERNILNMLPFRCQHEAEGCEAVIKYEDMKKHLEADCVKKVFFPKKEKPIMRVYESADGKGVDRRIVQQAALPDLFREPDEEGEQNNEWRFQENVPVPVQAPREVEQEEEEDVDMGGLFGDDDDY